MSLGPDQNWASTFGINYNATNDLPRFIPNQRSLASCLKGKENDTSMLHFNLPAGGLHHFKCFSTRQSAKLQPI